jgi:hypothetical protein
MVPTKFSLHFYEFSTNFYAFYKIQQKGYTIEDASLLLGPWKEIGTRNWVPRPWEAAAPAKFRRAGCALSRGTGREVPQAHLGLIGEVGRCGRDSGEGARRRRPAPAAGARASARVRLGLVDARAGGVK